MIDFSPLCPPALPLARAPAAGPAGKADFVDDDEEVRRLDLVKYRQPGHRLAAQVHEGERLAQHAPPRSPTPTRADQRLVPLAPPRRPASRRRQLRRRPRSRRCAACRGTAAPGLPSPTTSFSAFLAFVLLAFLLGLALLDDLGLRAGGRRRRRGRPPATGSSAFARDDVDEHRVGVAHRRPRGVWWRRRAT